MLNPSFYLTAAGESDNIVEPRACWIEETFSNSTGAPGILLVRIEPPIIGQHYGLGGSDLDHLLLSPKHVGVSLLEIDDWPCHVYVARILNSEILCSRKIDSKKDVEVIAWGVLFPTIAEADRFVKAHSVN